MMDEYIKKQDILNNLEWHDKNCGEINYWGAVEVVEHTIPADVAPLVHGRWEHNSYFPDRFICYGCGAMFDMWKHEQRLFNYCPNCGAKMDGGKNDAID